MKLKKKGKRKLGSALGSTDTSPGIGMVEPAGAHNPGNRPEFFERPLDFKHHLPGCVSFTFCKMNKIIISCLFFALVYLFPGIQTAVIFGGFQIESIEIGIINLMLLIPAYALFLALWEIRKIPRIILRGFLVVHGLAIIGMGIQSFGGELHSGILGQTVIPSVAIFTPLCLFLPHWKSYRRKGAEPDSNGNAEKPPGVERKP